ncbi:MAG: sugar kinase [Candidatus Aminicenantes bacterium RBG_19FT_COMBO_59_29]|nr:MAG: sugar kinase [Candidatus Aminicenantes bacterium RBG_19FT_COMBO_59_29]
MSLVIVGSLAFDTIQTPWERRERIVGGSGTYCSLAASFFTCPKIVGIVGQDFPAAVLKLFKARGIDTEGLEVSRGKTFHWEGRYGYDPNQRETIRTDINVYEEYRPRLPASYRKADIVFLANIDPGLQDDILAQVRKPKLVAMDTMNHWIRSRPETIWRVLKKVDIMFANDEEIRMLTEEANLIKAGKKILSVGPRLVVTKKGEHGALVFGRGFVFGVLAHPCENVVDPTGAGDSFAGGFLGYLDKVQRFAHPDIRRAAVFGSVLASFTIEDFGIGRLKTLTRREIEARFRRFKKLVSF